MAKKKYLTLLIKITKDSEIIMITKISNSITYRPIVNKNFKRNYEPMNEQRAHGASNQKK